MRVQTYSSFFFSKYLKLTNIYIVITQLLLQYVSEVNVNCVLIYASSSSAYGDVEQNGDKIAMREDDPRFKVKFFLEKMFVTTFENLSGFATNKTDLK